MEHDDDERACVGSRKRERESESACEGEREPTVWENSTQFLPLSLICDLQWNTRQEFSSILEYWIVVHALPKGISWHSHSSYTLYNNWHQHQQQRHSPPPPTSKFAWKVESSANAYKRCMAILCLLLFEDVCSPAPPSHQHDVYASQPV